MNLYLFILQLFLAISAIYCRNFSVDYENNCFIKDGKPFRYISGTVHYFRVPAEFWYDRLYKMKMGGLNAIQTYVEWSHHEPEPGVYNFDGNYNLPKFLKTANDLGLLVILRAGPFIDAERDMGGLPYWLLRIDPNMKLRTYDKNYITYMDRWFNVLLKILRPFLYVNGGPIITVQIENEYGSTGLCDAQYKSHLRDLFNRLLGNEAVLFTTDGSSTTSVMCGKVDGVLSTIDFGTGVNVTELFQMLRWHQAKGPLANSEFYPGWLDHWAQPHAKVSSDAVVKTLTDILNADASVNIYVYHGGTSFGFSAGSNLGGNFQACPTSYDYDAPLNEAGDPTPKYFDIRNTIKKFLPLPPGPLPSPAPKLKTNPIKLQKAISLWNYLEMNGKPIFSPAPLSFEKLYQPYGFVLYQTTVTFIPTDPVVLTVNGIGDRGHVYVNKVLQGILSRELKVYSIPIRVLKGETIEILVENQGRVCYGDINDQKGIFQNVTLGSQTLLNWVMTPVKLDAGSVNNLNSIQMVGKINTSNDVYAPAIYHGEISLKKEDIKDTFLQLNGWHKGVAFVNNFNLGRYWPIVGPQITLYVPSILFKPLPNVNQITILELEESPCNNGKSCTVQFVDTPNIDGPTPV